MLTSCGGRAWKWGSGPDYPKPEWAERGSWIQRKPETVIFHAIGTVIGAMRPDLLKHVLGSKLHAEHARLLDEEIRKIWGQFAAPTSSSDEESRPKTYRSVMRFTRRILKRTVLENVWIDPESGISYAYSSLRVPQEELETFVKKMLAK